MKLRTILSAIVMATFLAPSAFAEKPRRPKKPKAKTAKQYLKEKRYDFTADEIEGVRLAPMSELLSGRKPAEHTSLIRVRPNFVPEILKSSETL